MKISDYFSKNNGTGVLSTANKDGEVNAAIYAKPHVQGAKKISFIMRNKKSRANLLENPKAHYLFIEGGGGYKGIRIHLTMIEETDNQELIEKLARRSGENDQDRYLVTFHVDKTLELVGDMEVEVD